MIETTTAVHSGMELAKIATRLEDARYQQYINSPEYSNEYNSRFLAYGNDVKKNHEEMELQQGYDMNNKSDEMDKEFKLSMKQMKVRRQDTHRLKVSSKTSDMKMQLNRDISAETEKMNQSFEREHIKAYEDILKSYATEISSMQQQIAQVEKQLSEKKTNLKHLQGRENTESTNEMLRLDRKHMSNVAGMKATKEKKFEDDSSKTKGELDEQYGRDLEDEIKFQGEQHDEDVAKVFREMDTTFKKDVATVEKKKRQELDDIIGEAIGTPDKAVYSITQSFKVCTGNDIEIFMNACSVGDTLVVSELIAGKKVVTTSCHRGSRALHFAAYHGQYTVVCLLLNLLQNEASWDAKNADGNTARHLVQTRLTEYTSNEKKYVQNQAMEDHMIRLSTTLAVLLRAEKTNPLGGTLSILYNDATPENVGINAKDTDNNNVLKLHVGDGDVCTLLLKLGAECGGDKSSADGDKSSAGGWAVACVIRGPISKKPSKEITDPVFRLGNNVQTLQKKQWMEYANVGDMCGMHELMKNEPTIVNTMTEGEMGWSALHVAVYHGFFQLVYLLLSQNVDPSQESKDGTTPMEIAMERMTCCQEFADEHKKKKDVANAKGGDDATTHDLNAACGTAHFMRAQTTLAVLLRQFQKKPVIYPLTPFWATDIHQTVACPGTLGINTPDDDGHTLLYFMKKETTPQNLMLVPILERSLATADGKKAEHPMTTARRAFGHNSETCMVDKRAVVHYAKQSTKSKLHRDAYQTMQQRLPGVGSYGASECRSNPRVAVRKPYTVGAPMCVAQHLENAVMSALHT